MERAENRAGRRAPAWAAAALACVLATAQLTVSPSLAESAEDPPPPTTTTGSDGLPLDDDKSDDDVRSATANAPALVIGGVTGSLAAAAPGGGAAASGGEPARRLRQMGSIPFPMEPRPKCQILDSFGDGRSGGRSHAGTDILASLGQPVYAVADGTLTKQFVDGLTSSLSGNGWRLQIPDRTFFYYFHLSGFPDGLTAGTKVKRGDLIGFVGDTGNPGPGNYHLHFEYHPLGGEAIDPVPLLEIPSTCKVH